MYLLFKKKKRKKSLSWCYWIMANIHLDLQPCNKSWFWRPLMPQWCSSSGRSYIILKRKAFLILMFERNHKERHKLSLQPLILAKKSRKCSIIHNAVKIPISWNLYRVKTQNLLYKIIQICWGLIRLWKWIKPATLCLYLTEQWTPCSSLTGKKKMAGSSANLV